MSDGHTESEVIVFVEAEIGLVVEVAAETVGVDFAVDVDNLSLCIKSAGAHHIQSKNICCDANHCAKIITRGE